MHQVGLTNHLLFTFMCRFSCSPTFPLVFWISFEKRLP